MAQTVQILRSSPPVTLLPGVLSVELTAQTKLWVGSSGGNRLLLSSDPADAPVALPLYLKLTGGTLTGPLVLAAAPTLPLGAATKAYADTKLALAGGTLTGPLILNADPTVPLGAATKQYADTKVALAGGTMTGPLILNADPTVPLGAATKQYADTKVALAGGTMTGPLILSNDPSAPMGAATKGYVDAKFPVPIAQGGTGSTNPTAALAALGALPLIGGTLSGSLTVNATVQSTGTNAGFAFQQRDTGTSWILYATGGSARIFNGSADVLGVTNVGVLQLNSVPVAQTSGNYNIIFDHAGNQGLALGNASDPSNYYRNTGHYFGSIGGTTPFMALSASGLYVVVNVLPNSTNLYSCGTVTAAWYQVQAFNFLNPSDRRDKTDIEDLPACLDLVAQLKPRRFKWVSGPEEDRNVVHWGFVAQDVGDVMRKSGHAFGGHKDNPEGGQSIAYHELTAVLWKAVQELTQKIADLEETRH